MTEYVPPPPKRKERDTVLFFFFLLGPYDLTAGWDRVLRREPCRGKKDIKHSN